MKITSMMALGAMALAFGGAAVAQSQGGSLGGSMGTQASATPQSTSGAMASGAHHTPVAKAQRHQTMKHKSHAMKSSSAGGSSMGSGDMTPSGNANPTNQH